MDILVDPALLTLVESIDNDIPKVVTEALNLWIKEKLITRPITKKHCTNNKNPCNECSTFTKTS